MEKITQSALAVIAIICAALFIMGSGPRHASAGVRSQTVVLRFEPMANLAISLERHVEQTRARLSAVANCGR